MLDNKYINLPLCGVALAVLVVTFVFMAVRWTRGVTKIDLADLYVIMTGIYFGTYSFIDSFLIERPWIRADHVIWAHIMILIIVLSAWILTRSIPEPLLASIQLNTIMRRYSEVDGRLIMVLCAIILGVFVYGIYSFGIISWAVPVELERLPYWYTSSRMMIRPLAFCILSVSASRFFAIQNRMRYPWLISLIISLCIVALYGRRMFLGAIFIIMIIWIVTNSINIISKQVIIGFIISVIIIIAFSNIYNSYRAVGLTAANKQFSDVNAIDAMVGIDSTIGNLSRRRPIWLWNYLILEAQVDGYAMNPLYGQLLTNQIKAKIPRAFWPSKGMQKSADILVAEYYSLDGEDYPDNMFAFALAEWGFYSLIITPLGMYIFFLVYAIMLWVSVRHPLAIVLISGACLYSIVNVESSDPGRLMIYRTTGVFIISYCVAYVFYIHVRYIGLGAIIRARKVG